MLSFKIEQLALCPRDPAAAIALLNAMGAGDWAKDHVVAVGEVFGAPGRNEADLAFAYDMLGHGNELEVLHYTSGPNWMETPFHGHAVSHIGMHCGSAELEQWKEFFAERGIGIAQEVKTLSHENPVIAGKRWYHYCIFDTREILSVDVKFIVRLDEAPE